MCNYQLCVKEFKKMNDPVSNGDGHTKYVCYAQCSSIPDEFEDWMETNPRDQKMSTKVAEGIIDSLKQNIDFHELNRGIVMSIDKVTYDNEKKTAVIDMVDPTIHGNIDGGHTLRSILNLKRQGILSDDRYVFLELFTGIISPVELAAARNTSIQVDLKSIEELKNSFNVIKKALSSLNFKDRVAYKMNEHYYEDVASIDVREIITVLNMFNQALYPIKQKDGTIGEIQPIQSYTGKEISLKKYLNLGKEDRELITKKMTPIIQDIFDLWDTIEKEFPIKAAEANKRYGNKKYSKFNKELIVGKTLFSQTDIKYLVPKGIMYPLVGAFRALIVVDEITGVYGWRKSPLDVWNKIGGKLSSIVLEEKADNPEIIGKSTNLWSNLFKEVLLYGISF